MLPVSKYPELNSISLIAALCVATYFDLAIVLMSITQMPCVNVEKSVVFSLEIEVAQRIVVLSGSSTASNRHASFWPGWFVSFISFSSLRNTNFGKCLLLV